ncbi:MAG TPA: glycosyltransferase family 2 protein [Bacilli bacterium]|nr:glycosyltransferase family 2 protein [Bacilli bacterium]
MNPYLVIIPAYNESNNIGSVLEGLLGLHLPLDILVVNDGSMDNTAEAASRYPVKVLSHPFNMGYGAALQTGFIYARDLGYEYVFQFDSDGQHNPQDIPVLMRELQTSGADIVMGSRFLEGSSPFALGAAKRLGMRYFRWLIHRLTRVKVSDPTSGLRGLSRPVFEYYAGRDRFPADFPDADILIQMILRQYRIAEIPAHMRQREEGVSMHAGIKPFFYMIKISLAIFLVLLGHKLNKAGV